MMRHVPMSGAGSDPEALVNSAVATAGINLSATSSFCTVNFFAVVWMLPLIPVAGVVFFEDSATDITPVQWITDPFLAIDMKNHVSVSSTIRN